MENGERCLSCKNKEYILQRGNLEVYDKTIDVFRDYYQYEEIQGRDRKIVEKIPEAAFREAVANALIHRTWDMESEIRISMFDDRIEIVSPGGLPSGITEDE